MRIALMHPTYWPEVRRGAERLAHDLGVALTREGHDVTLLTTHRGTTAVSREEGVRVVRIRRPPHGWLDRRGMERHLTGLPVAAARLLRGRYDVVHALSHTDAWIAVKARAVGGPPVVTSLMGIPTKRSIESRRLRRPLLRAAVSGADAVTVLSEPAAREVEKHLGRRPLVLAPGVFTADFATDGRRSEEPTLISAASLDDPRKRGALLLRAFETLRAGRPGVRLLLAGRAAPPAVELPPGVERLQADDTRALARAYASAWGSVLPSVDEAFGLVLVESLAAGTPVVAAASGAPPEILGDELVGRLFRPDDQAELARALDEVLDLSGRDGIAELCRRRAQEYDWAAVMPAYTRLYRGVLSSSSARRRLRGNRLLQ